MKAPARINLALLLAAAVLSLSAAEDTRPSASFRAEHAEIATHLDHLDGMLGSLAGASEEEQRTTMAFVVRFLDEHIRAHAEWEEAKLYPLVDARACQGPEPFSASMRYEHGIVGRSIDELARLAASESPDPRAFALAGQRLLFLIAAHFEKEEEVYLPILDRSMTRQELEEALGGSEAH